MIREEPAIQLIVGGKITNHLDARVIHRPFLVWPGENQPANLGK